MYIDPTSGRDQWADQVVRGHKKCTPEHVAPEGPYNTPSEHSQSERVGVKSGRVRTFSTMVHDSVLARVGTPITLQVAAEALARWGGRRQARNAHFKGKRDESYIKSEMCDAWESRGVSPWGQWKCVAEHVPLLDGRRVKRMSLPPCGGHELEFRRF